MKTIKALYAKIPNWLKPSKKQVAAFKVVFKAYVKGVLVAGVGVALVKFQDNPEIAVLVAAVLHPIYKWLDPNDPQLGIKSDN